jgi:hypothetical protein
MPDANVPMPNPVQTFCTSSRRPETGRSRRRLGACPSLSWRPRRTRKRPSAGVEKQVGPQRRQSRAGLRGWRRWVGGPTGTPWATRPCCSRRAAGRVAAVGDGVGGVSVPGRSSNLKGAARRKRRPCGPPLTSEPLRPSGRSRGQADGLPTGCAPPAPSPTRR